MLRLVFALILICQAVYGLGADPFSFKGSSGSSIGVYISEIRTGRVVAEHNASRALIPASVQKCVTAATVQLMLDEGSPFTTRAEIFGDISDGTVNGNLYIVGAGDPTLGSRHFKERDSFKFSIVEWLKNLGIDSISGDIIMDGGRYPAIGISPYWLLEDTAWEYGAGLYGINYGDNSFNMTLRPGEDADAGNVEVVNMLVPGQKTDVKAMRGEGSGLLTIYGTLASQSYTSRYSVPIPESVLYDDLVSLFADKGIGLGGNPVMDSSGSKTEFGYDSPVRDEILKVMMHKSNNLFAEGMLRAIVGNSGENTFDKAIALEKDLWTAKGLDLSSVRWLDGSGLAPVNRMSPRLLASVLEFMAKSSMSRRYVDLFPLVGKEGTVARLIAKTRLAGKLALKSGSMSGVLCYAGYKLDGNGKPTHTVVIMVNGATCGSSEIRGAIGRYLLSVF